MRRFLGDEYLTVKPMVQTETIPMKIIYFNTENQNGHFTHCACKGLGVELSASTANS